MSRGICLIAAGHPAYGQWAFNLALSIKYSDPNAKITLLHYGNGASHIHTYHYHFDKMIQIPEHCVTRHGVESLLRSKVCLYDLSPYDETIFVDADVICFPNKKLTDLFDVLKNVDFTIGNRGLLNPEVENKYAWTPSNKLIEKYSTNGKCWNLSSEFIYFKKTDSAKNIFDIAKKYFEDPEVEYRSFAGGVPDELAFQIAMMKTLENPHKENFLPFYWEAHEKKQLQLHELYKTDFFGYSMGGNQVHQIPMENYNNLARFYQNEFGLRFPFLMRDKRSFLPERTSI